MSDTIRRNTKKNLFRVVQNRTFLGGAVTDFFPFRREDAPGNKLE